MVKKKQRNSHYSVFLEKLIRFAKKEKIERISGEYQVETFEKFTFEILELIIEKKLPGK
jgi:hypothetical protein